MIDRITAAAATAAGRWRWRKAHNLTDLANLQADRIADNLTKSADDDCGPEWFMYSALVALGRAGVVVADWRPGTSTISNLDESLETRAVVTGFASDETKGWLDNLLYDAGRHPGAIRYELDSVFDLYGPGCIDYDQSGGDDRRRRSGHWVERVNGTATARIGDQMNAGQVYRAFPTRLRLQQELRRAWQITICAPAWGDGRMFADLLHMLYGSSNRVLEDTNAQQ